MHLSESCCLSYLSCYQSFYPNVTTLRSGFYSAAALLVMQSAVIRMAIPSVRLSVSRNTLSRRMKIESRSLNVVVVVVLMLPKRTRLLPGDIIKVETS